MTRAISESHPLHRLFRGITEQTFLAELGIGDPGLVGYVANLLARFVPNDTIWKLRGQNGQRLCQELGWTGESVPQIEVLDRLQDVCRAVQGLDTPAISAATVQSRLETFEQWFLAHRKASFYTLFDQYVQEASVVDF